MNHSFQAWNGPFQPTHSDGPPCACRSLRSPSLRANPEGDSHGQPLALYARMLTFIVVLSVCIFWLLSKQAFLQAGNSTPPSGSTNIAYPSERRGWPYNELNQP